MNMKQKKIKIEPRIKLNYNIYICIAEEVSTLFRGTSLTTTLMDQYMKMVAIPYLQKTIGDVVAKILDCKQSCEVGRQYFLFANCSLNSTSMLSLRRRRNLTSVILRLRRRLITRKA